MSDTGRPEKQRTAWAPLAVDSDSRTQTNGQMESGAVLRSPARQTVDAAVHQVAPGAWPWDVTDSAATGTSTTAPAVATARLYRNPDDSLTSAGTDSGDNAATAYLRGGVGVPTPGPTVDPFDLRDSDDQKAGDERGMKTWGVVLVDLVLTTIAAIIDLRLFGQLTWITGLAFVAACLITSLSVRSQDLAVAVITPPLAFVASVAISTQTVALGSGGSLILREGKIIITSLAFNAPYVFAGTGLALIIVALRALRRTR